MANEVRLVDINAFPLLPNKLEGDLSEYERGYLDAQANLNNLPTIDPESLRPKGRWVVQRENEISKTVYCTNCRKDFYIRKKGELQLDTLPYCPNCGAKMEA